MSDAVPLTDALKRAALAVALVVSWLFAGGLVPASAATSAPCHAASGGMHAPTKAGHNVKLAASVDVSQADHRSSDGRHCPNGGLCCDVLCHAIMPLPDQAGNRCDIGLARHGFTPGMTLALHDVNGLDRPPRRLPS